MPTPKLCVLMPSRGRATEAYLAMYKGLTLSTADTKYWLAVDNDDASIEAYKGGLSVLSDAGYRSRWRFSVGPRNSLSGWTNWMAKHQTLEDYDYFASFGDDHVPETKGWDSALIQAIEGMGGTGFAYPNDLRRNDIPEAVVMSADIVRALGWMMEPSLTHFYVDNVWSMLGRGAHCIRYCPQIMVPHHHYEVDPLVEHDQTYVDAERHGPDDAVAFDIWRTERMEADIATIVALRKGKVS